MNAEEKRAVRIAYRRSWGAENLLACDIMMGYLRALQARYEAKGFRGPYYTSGRDPHWSVFAITKSVEPGCFAAIPTLKVGSISSLLDVDRVIADFKTKFPELFAEETR